MILIDRFPYSKTIQGTKKRPILWIEIKNLETKGSSVVFPCILDTGADYCLLPASLCSVLGHDLESNLGTVNVHGINGKLKGHLHTNIISFGNEKLACPFFMCENWKTGIGLLGHDGFFSEYSVFFNSRKSYFEIYK